MSDSPIIHLPNYKLVTCVRESMHNRSLVNKCSEKMDFMVKDMVLIGIVVLMGELGIFSLVEPICVYLKRC